MQKWQNLKTDKIYKKNRDKRNHLFWLNFFYFFNLLPLTDASPLPSAILKLCCHISK